MAGRDDILWLVTARSGSQSIPDKNIKPLGGLPLLAYRIRAARTISEKEHVWISTDSEYYAGIAKEHGANVPFLRPHELSTDVARSADVVLHAMNFAEKNNLSYKYIGLLEPTSPFVYREDLMNALQQLSADDQADGIVAVKEVKTHALFITEESHFLEELADRIQKMSNTHRQHFARQITPSGGFYLSKWDAFKEKMTFYTPRCMSYLLPWESELEIDEPHDWAWAEFLLERKIVNLNKIFER